MEKGGGERRHQSPGSRARAQERRVARHSSAAVLVDALAKELQALVDSEGMALDVLEIVRETARATAGNRNSMWQDLMRGRRSEIREVTGRFIELADARGVLFSAINRCIIGYCFLKKILLPGMRVAMSALTSREGIHRLCTRAGSRWPWTHARENAASKSVHQQAFTREGATMSTKSLEKLYSNGKNPINGNGAHKKTRKKVTTATIRARKGGKKITSVTAYDYPTAKLVDDADVDVILVGDSLGMVVLGYPDTTKVTLDDMAHHTRAVSRANPKALLVADMPFLSFGVSARDTILNAGRLIQEGCAEAVKLEGGVRVKEEIRAVVEAQIPVMGHVGLTPQSVHAFGGFKVQGKTDEGADQVLRDAVAVQEGGAFSIVLEGVPAALGARVTREVDIPTIGIGAGPDCDGQVLVTHDMLGLFRDFTPKFVRVYADVGQNDHRGDRQLLPGSARGRVSGGRALFLIPLIEGDAPGFVLKGYRPERNIAFVSSSSR